jgi:hypothetical protein
MQSVPITTEVVSSNPTQARCTRYNIGVGKGRLMVFKFSATFNNISVNIMVVSFLVEETGVPEENN